MKPSLRYLLIFSFVLLAMVSGGMATWFLDKPSDDTRHVHFSIGKVKYVMPRNYLSKMSDWRGGPQEGVRLRVIYPGFAPYSAETKDCFERKKRCSIVDIYLHDGDRRSTDAFFESHRQYYNNQTSEKGPHGFDLYATGRKSWLQRRYRKHFASQNVYISCSSGICDSFVATQAGNQFHFSFPERQLEIIEDVITGMLDLIQSFVGDERT